MSDELDLEPIEARCVAASPGPWTDSGGELMIDNGDAISLIDLFGRPNWKADIAFITCSRTDVPALIAEIKRLRALLNDNEADKPIRHDVWIGRRSDGEARLG